MSELINVYSMGRVYSGLVQSTQRLDSKDCHWQTLEALSRSKAIWSASCMIVFCRRASKTRHTNPGRPKVYTEFSYLCFEPKDTQDWVLESSIYLIFWNSYLQHSIPAWWNYFNVWMWSISGISCMKGSQAITRTLFNVKKQYIGFDYLDRLPKRKNENFQEIVNRQLNV